MYLPLWSQSVTDGDYELTYDGLGTSTAVTITAEPVLRISEPRASGIVWDELRVLGGTIVPDGRFLVVQRGEEEDQRQINVVLNWFEELKHRVSSTR